MRRRELVLGLAALLPAPAARAQQKPVPVIGILDAKGANPDLLVALRKGLTEGGFKEGRDVVLQYKGVDGHYDRFPAVAAAFIRDRVAIIVAPTLPSALAAKAATATIPIVFMLGDDPVKQGLIDSLNRPGGNATGLSMLTAGLDSKRLQLLRDLAPTAVRVGLLVNPENPSAATQINDVQSAARAIVKDIEILRAHNDEEIAPAFAAMAKLQIDALLVGADPFFNSRRQQIVELARRYRVPAVYEWREFVDAGGLASYGSSLTDDYRRLGVYAAKILAGAKPADLPVMQPTRYELIINLKTARALGLTLPPLLLAQADEVIE